jgi:hypothetical protein
VAGGLIDALQRVRLQSNGARHPVGDGLEAEHEKADEHAARGELGCEGHLRSRESRRSSISKHRFYDNPLTLLAIRLQQRGLRRCRQRTMAGDRALPLRPKQRANMRQPGHRPTSSVGRNTGRQTMRLRSRSEVGLLSAGCFNKSGRPSSEPRDQVTARARQRPP